MKKAIQSLRTQFLAGLLFLFTLSVCLLLVAKVFVIAQKIVHQLFPQLHRIHVAGITILSLVTAIVLLLLCLLFGLLIRLTLFTRINAFLEKNVLRFLPGYEYYKMLLSEKIANDTNVKPGVLVCINGCWQPGLLVEAGAEYCVVLVVQAPKGANGDIYVVPVAQVVQSVCTAGEFHELMQHFGKGLLPLVPPVLPQAAHQGLRPNA